MINNDDAIYEIKSKLPLEEYIQKLVPLKRNGNRWVGLCPFHQEKSPSFTINETAGFFHCFGCHASGDLFTFYQQFHSVNFKDALEALAEEAGVQLIGTKQHITGEVKKHRLYEMYTIAQEHFKKNLYDSKNTACLQYLQKRNISKESIEKFSLGYSENTWDTLTTLLRRANYSFNEINASGLTSLKETHQYDKFRNRLMFPILTLTGTTVAFGGRVLPTDDASPVEQAKYMNSPESAIYTKGEHLYGLPQARKSIATQKYITVTEGYLDTITLHQYGYTTAVALLGTALTVEHVSRIASITSTVEIIFDADTAGKSASLRSTELCLQKGLTVRVLILPEGEDIDSYLHKNGKESFDTLRKNAITGIQYCGITIRTKPPQEIAQWVATFLHSIEDTLIKEQYRSQLTAWINLTEQDTKAIKNEMRLAPRKNMPIHIGDTTIEREMMILKHLLHYSHNIMILKNAGLDITLQSKEIKEILLYIIQNNTVENIIQHITLPAQKIFIQANVDVDVSPEKEKEELADILIYLEKEYKKRSMASITTLMNTSDDIETLLAIQTILKGHSYEQPERRTTNTGFNS